MKRVWNVKRQKKSPVYSGRFKEMKIVFLIKHIDVVEPIEVGAEFGEDTLFSFGALVVGTE